MLTIQQYAEFYAWKEKYGQFSEAAHKRDEAGKFSASGGGGKKAEPKAKAKKPAKSVPKQRKPRGSSVPKDRAKLTISAAGQALKAKGYKLGSGRTTPVNGKWTTEYEITHPNGKKQWMHVDDVRDIVYGTPKKPPVQVPATVMPRGAVPPVQTPAKVMPKGAAPPVQIPRK